MTESIIAGFLSTFTPSVLLAILGGVIIGLIFGIMPGIGVTPIMAIIIPLTFGMDPTFGPVAAYCLHAGSGWRFHVD
ncbi:tripartite tricarboxylate transporter permease, partial [Thermodesulfobacteriota bacterium]